MFEAIGEHFGGLVSISSKILNMLIVLKLVATIEIQDKKRGNSFLRFGDITPSELPNIINCDLILNDFLNSLNLNRLYQVMDDEVNSWSVMEV